MSESIYSKILCRSPHGERGLKYIKKIEILLQKCRSPHGERGLKSIIGYGSISVCCRSPHGERGLKFTYNYFLISALPVALLTESVD